MVAFLRRHPGGSLSRCCGQVPFACRLRVSPLHPAHTGGTVRLPSNRSDGSGPRGDV